MQETTKPPSTIVEYKYFEAKEPIEVYGSLEPITINAGDIILCKIKSTTTKKQEMFLDGQKVNTQDYLQKKVVGKSTKGKDVVKEVISIPDELLSKMETKKVDSVESWIHPAIIQNGEDNKPEFKGWGTISISSNGNLMFHSNAKESTYRGNKKIIQCK